MMVNTSIMSRYIYQLFKPIKLEFNRSILNTSRQILLNLAILGSAFIIFYFAGSYFIKILASDELLPAIPIVFALFSIDAIRCIVSPLGYFAFSKGDVVSFVGIDIIGGLVSLIVLLFYIESSLVSVIFWSQGIAAVLALLFILFRLLHNKIFLNKLRNING